MTTHGACLAQALWQHHEPPTSYRELDIMTDAEFKKVQKELRERKARTSFPASNPRDLYNAHSGHAEYGSSQH